MLVNPCVMLEYKLTTATDNWFTVVIKANPTAATISAYSTGPALDPLSRGESESSS